MAVIKTDVKPSVFGKLDELLRQEGNPFQVAERNLGGKERLVNCLRIMPGDRKFDGEHVQIALELMEEVENSGDQYHSSPVRRSMLDRLCDELGIYPRSRVVPEEIAELLRTMHNAMSMISTTIDFSRKIRGPSLEERFFVEMEQFFQAERVLDERLKEFF